MMQMAFLDPTELPHGITGLEIETAGAFVAPNSHHMAARHRISSSVSSETASGETIVIADRTWFKTSDSWFDTEGAFVEGPRVTLVDVPTGFSTLDFDVTPLWGFDEVVASFASAADDYQGRSVTRYWLEADADLLEVLSDRFLPAYEFAEFPGLVQSVSTMLELLGADAIDSLLITVWFDHDAGVFVAWGFEAGGQVDYGGPIFSAEFSGLVELSDVNSSAVTIDPPSEYGSFEDILATATTVAP